MQFTCPKCDTKQKIIVNLNDLRFKQVDFSNLRKGINQINFTLPTSKDQIIFKLMDYATYRELEKMEKAYAKIKTAKDVTGFLSKSIVSYNGVTDQFQIMKFVNSMKSIDSLALRKYITKVSPGVDTTINISCQNDMCDYDQGVMLAIQADFFWPHIA